MPIPSRAADVPTYCKLAVDYAQNVDKKKRWKAQRVDTDMVVSSNSKQSTAPRFIVNLAAATCSCCEPQAQTLGTACVYALVASTSTGARKLLTINKFFAIGLRASDAAMAFDAAAAATLSAQMKESASVEWRDFQVSEQIVWPIVNKRKRQPNARDPNGDAPGDTSTASTSTGPGRLSTSTGPRASGRFLGSIDKLPTK